MTPAGFGMRRSIWGPVALCVLALLASGLLPHADVRTWRMPVVAASWNVAPSWPVPALRGYTRTADGLVWGGWAPSWPVPALRRSAHVQPGRVDARPLAGIIRGSRPVFSTRTFVSVGLILAMVLAWVVVSRGLVRLQSWPVRRLMLVHTITQLAERGVAHSHIARRAGLPRDAVRAMLRASAARQARRRA